MRIWRTVACGAAMLAISTGAGAQARHSSPASQRIDVDRLPVTDAQLQDFPFLSWPTEYQPQNTPVSQEVGHFYFWDGHEEREVEGRTFLVTLDKASSGTFNEYLIKKTVHDQLKAEGAVMIESAKIPREILLAIPEVDRQSLSAGMGDPYNDPLETWVIKRPRHMIWIQYSDNSAQASLAVVASPTAQQP